MKATSTGLGTLTRILNGLGRLRRDTSANTMAIVALSLVPLVGTVGLGLDVGQWVLWKRQLHSAADAAALAGATANSGSFDVDTAVRRSLAHNDLRNFNIIAIETPPTVGNGKDDAKAVRVVLTAQESLSFSSMFLTAAPILTVEATAFADSQTSNCVITLDTAGTGVTISGSSTISMSCGLASNSNFDATSSDSIDTEALSAVGTVNAGSGVTGDTKINDGIDPVADPFAVKIPTPNTNGSCSPGTAISSSGNITVSPGCYKGLSITSGTITLLPGIYYLGQGGLKVGAGANAQGDDVTLIFTNTENTFNASKVGTLSVAGNSTINLSATLSGIYAGVLMYQDPRTPTKSTLFVTGDSSSSFEGAIYAPSVEVKFTGNSSMVTDCLQIVSLFASFEGNTNITNNCPSGSGASSFGAVNVLRLIG